MEAAQARAKLANISISDKSLFAIANCMILVADKYMYKMKAWNKRRHDERTW